MASGEICAVLGGSRAPDDDAATLDYTETGSVPKSQILVLDFATSADEFAEFHGHWQNYDDGGITVSFWATFDTATSGTGVFGADIQAFAVGNDSGASKTFAYTTDSNTAASPAGKIFQYDINLSDETNMVNGNAFILRILRDVSADNAAGDLELWVDSMRITEQ